MSITRTFVIVANGDVVATIDVPESSPNRELLWNGLSSNPIIVESDNSLGVGLGWTYDGENFNPPQG